MKRRSSFAPYPPRAIPRKTHGLVGRMRSVALAFAAVCCPPAAGVVLRSGRRVTIFSARDVLLVAWNVYEVVREVGLPPEKRSTPGCAHRLIFTHSSVVPVQRHEDRSEYSRRTLDPLFVSNEEVPRTRPFALVSTVL